MKQQERRELDQAWQPVVHRRRVDGHFAASNSPLHTPIDIRAYCNLWIETSAQDAVANDLRIVERVSAKPVPQAAACAPVHDLHARSMTSSCHQLPRALIGDALWRARTVRRIPAAKMQGNTRLSVPRSLHQQEARRIGHACLIKE